MPNRENNKRIAKNTIMLYLRMLFSMAVSLYTSRIVLNTLGVEDFGIYNVVGGIVVMFGFLNNAMSASTQRFLTYEMGKGSVDQLSRIFNMSLIIHGVIAIVVLLISETIGLWFLNTQLNIPIERMNAANWVYQFSILAFIITILYVPYNAIIIAHEEMGIYAIISTIEVILKLLIVFILVWFGFDKLKLYSVLIFVVSLSIGIIYLIYCKKNFKEFKFHYLWNKQLFYQMSSFANWNLLGVFAGITYNQGVNILLNIFFGPTINAARGIAYQVQGAINGFVTNFQIAVNPQITKSHAIDDKQYMHSLVFKASKFSFYFLLLLSLPLIIETKFILKLWLKMVPDYTVIFTRLVLIDILICSLSGSLQTLAQATGNIRKYQLVVSGILLMNLPLSYLLIKLGFAPQITFYISILCSFSALFARLIILNQIESFPAKDFILTILLKALIVSFIASILPLYVSKLIFDPISQFLIVTLISIASVLMSVWVFGITKSENLYLKTVILKYFQNH